MRLEKAFWPVVVVLLLCLMWNFAYGGECDKKKSDKPFMQAQLTDQTIVVGNKAIMFIYDDIIYQDKKFRTDIAVLKERTEIRDIEVWVNSPGGIARTGIAVADMINTAEKDGFRIVGVAYGLVSSIAVAIYLACDRRYAGPGTLFMVHKPTVGNQQAQTQTEHDYKTQQKLLLCIEEIYLDILVAETKIKDRNKWAEWMRDTEHFSAETALSRGVVHGIR